MTNKIRVPDEGPARRPLYIYRGDVRTRVIRFYNAAGPIDISDDQFTLRVRRKRDGVTVFDLTVGSGLTISPSETGRLQYRPTEAQTRLLLAGEQYEWDIQWTRQATGEKITPLAGPVLVSGDIAP
jgi:hypothetical protein